MFKSCTWCLIWWCFFLIIWLKLIHFYVDVCDTFFSSILFCRRYKQSFSSVSLKQQTLFYDLLGVYLSKVNNVERRDYLLIITIYNRLLKNLKKRFHFSLFLFCFVLHNGCNFDIRCNHYTVSSEKWLMENAITTLILIFSGKLISLIS